MILAAFALCLAAALYPAWRASRLDPVDAIRRCHDLGVMVNGSFVFGLDEDGPDVFARTVEWAVSRGVETATFHVMKP